MTIKKPVSRLLTTFPQETRHVSSLREKVHPASSPSEENRRHRRLVVKAPSGSSSGGWITIGGDSCDPGSGGHCGGTHVFIRDGKIVAGPAALTGQSLSDLKHPKKPKNELKPVHSPNPDEESSKPDVSSTPELGGKTSLVSDQVTSPPKDNPESQPESKPEESHGGEGESGAIGGGEVGERDAETSESLAGKTEGPEGITSGEGGDVGDQSSDQGTIGGISRGVKSERVPAKLDEVDRRINRFENFFRSKGQHKVADWMGVIREHINAMGGEEALKALGEGSSVVKPGERDKPVQYWGVGTEEANWKDMGEFFEQYLSRNGIFAITAEASEPDMPLISALGKPDRYVAGQDFKPSSDAFKNKLDEAQHLPGLEKSQDIEKLLDKPVTHLTDDVMSELDNQYGKGQWIVKCYDDNAAAGYGIFFPQKAQKVKEDARNTIWTSGQELAKYGFEHIRDTSGKLVGIKHKGGDEYLFDDALTQIRKSPDVGGNEHEVREDSENNKFFKITKGDNFGYSKDVKEYLKRHEIANEMWPELGYSFHGLTEGVGGKLRAVMSMNRIEGEHPSNDEINRWFGDKGFEPVFDHDKDWREWDPEDGYYVEQWRDPKTGTIFADAASQNFMKVRGGGLVPIDLDIKPGDNYESGKITAATSIGGGQEGGAGGASKIEGNDTGPTSGVNQKKPGSAPPRGVSPQEALAMVSSAGDDPGVLAAVKAAGHYIEPNRYEQTIHGEVRHWADLARNNADHENGAMLPEGSFMVQPAFPAVGISDEERAAGKTWHGTNEGRVHLVTREDGTVEVIPHSTWFKGGDLPVVFEDDHTRAMAKAAQDAINSLPMEARRGQVYAPDVMKTADGYKVVELNAQGDTNGSGYLHDNGFTIDAYTSYLAGREPAHVAFIRQLLTKRKQEKWLRYWVAKGLGLRKVKHYTLPQEIPPISPLREKVHPVPSLSEERHRGMVFKGRGTCKVGERADLTGCTPASGGVDNRSNSGQGVKPVNRLAKPVSKLTIDGPSKPDERHPNVSPVARSFKVPPPKKGMKGGGKPTRGKGDKSQTFIGDVVEGLAKELGFRSILPKGKRSHGPGEVKRKGSTIDVEYDHSGKAYEIKACLDTSTEYRLKAKKEEKVAKVRYAKRNKLTPYTMVAVVETESGEVSFYTSKKPGLIGAEVNSRDYDYVGSSKSGLLKFGGKR